MLRKDKQLLETLIQKYGKSNVNTALIKLTERCNTITESKNFIDDSTVVINNEDYSLVEFDNIYDLYDAADELNIGEAFYWHGGQIIYKNYDGRIMACYQDDHDNCWEI